MLIASAGAAMLVAAGCSSDSSPAQDDPTTRAMSDPMNYSPSHDNEDISGGGVTDFHGDAFKKDMDHVLNP
ncbi:MAG: hypothetical protein ABSB74_20740 [Tepidisphaeraceae bacterium]